MKKHTNLHLTKKYLLPSLVSVILLIAKGYLYLLVTVKLRGE